MKIVANKHTNALKLKSVLFQELVYNKVRDLTSQLLPGAIYIYPARN